jgi:hypothetical protein
MSATVKHRELWEIAAEINAKWRRRAWAAIPLLTAMGAMRTMADSYPERVQRLGGVRYDPVGAPEVVRRFLESANDWHGADARRLKAELRALLREEET